jgi:hypothetical protein
MFVAEREAEVVCLDRTAHRHDGHSFWPPVLWTFAPQNRAGEKNKFLTRIQTRCVYWQ